MPIPNVVKDNAIMWIHSHIAINFPKLKHELESTMANENGKELTEKIEC